MAFRPEDKKRSIIPRWRSFRNTLLTNELGDRILRSEEGERELPESLTDKISEWHVNPTLSIARQLVGSAIVHDRYMEARSAAKLLLRSSGVSRSTRHLAEVVMGKSKIPRSTHRLHVFIRESRKKTRELPKNPFPWVDLALGHTIVGKSESARKALLTAISLAPNSRFILRSAVRFFVHVGEFDMARDILLRCESIKNDPWLLASQIAVASLANKHPKFTRAARLMINNRIHEETHLSELVGALGTIDFESGRNRRAKQLFKRAIRISNENVVAQARWAIHNGLAIDLYPFRTKVQNGFEVRAWNHFYSKNWKSSISNSKEWLEYQQFSSSPALLGSYVSGVVLEDHPTAIRIIENGLRANPSNPMLLNNYAYSLASSGQFQKAERALKSIRTNGDSAMHIYKMATRGLLRFRQRRILEGQYFYSRGAEVARRNKKWELLKKLVIFWGLEEIRVGGEIPKQALDKIRLDKDPVVNVLAERLRRRSRRIKSGALPRERLSD